MMTSRNIEQNVAQLLLCADFLKPHDLDRALAASRDGAVPLSTMLLKHGVIAPQHLVAAMEVATETIAGRLSAPVGRDVLHLMGNYGLPLKEAMEKLGAVRTPNPWMSSLDKLACRQAPAPKE